MTKVIVLPHDTLCPDGAVIEAKPGQSVCEALLDHHIEIEHACEMSCACTTCHIHVREGGESLAPASDNEEDRLDKAWGVDTDSRLSCQAIVENTALTVEIPKYTINIVKENKA